MQQALPDDAEKMPGNQQQSQVGGDFVRLLDAIDERLAAVDKKGGQRPEALVGGIEDETADDDRQQTEQHRDDHRAAGRVVAKVTART